MDGNHLVRAKTVAARIASLAYKPWSSTQHHTLLLDRQLTSQCTRPAQKSAQAGDFKRNECIEANAACIHFGTQSHPEPLKDGAGVCGRRHDPMPATNCECFNPVALIKQAQTATYYVALKKEYAQLKNSDAIVH
ncbi:hypothetical protein [Rhodoferax lithotrophicus]|uniref:hypothetical protein n=1 Tax=Rhodoferax lithotrophicus TaxID=2798804 RepID=UPI001CC82D4C|nr:hypothetical protein [Rhodoferax sp. MIZ03]